MTRGFQPISEYALIGDCRAAALVCRDAAIDWCCMPRFDSGSCFARLLDREKGGHCSIDAGPGCEFSREYVDESLVLRTTLLTEQGEATVTDCMVTAEIGGDERSQIIRTIEGRRGSVDLRLEIVPRFDYGEVDAWVHHLGNNAYSAIGGNDGLLVWSDAELEARERHALEGVASVRPGERVRLLIAALDPVKLDQDDDVERPDPEQLDREVEQTTETWRNWAEDASLDGPDTAGAIRSAIVLKALTYHHTGAIIAAPTTSLPEGRGAQGDANWDYRYSWVRDSTFAVRSFAELGFEEESGAFRRFVERSAAGNAKDLQVLYGIGGERRLTEQTLDHLEGYRGAQPARVGNDACEQLQLDAYGQLVEQGWRWYERGHEPDDDYWRFLVELVEFAAEHWSDPDKGIWEVRGEPRHFVHSKVLCWAALDRGLLLAEHCMRKAPERRWRRVREEIREAIESDGYDDDRGVFVQEFGGEATDVALLRLPAVGFIDYQDERMIRTVDAIREDLAFDGLLRRQPPNGGAEEGAFLPASFWLAECLCRQGRPDDARQAFDAAVATANDLGLFSEEFDPEAGEMLGNFPQGLTHLSHIEAALALAERETARA